jgi:predicted metal-dependent hydrolase
LHDSPPTMAPSFDCDSPLHPNALLGLKHFNAGEYFEAHEELETAWRDETGEIRDLYKGILQAAITYLHVRRANYEGAVKVYERSQKWLTKWPNTCRGVDVERLRTELNAVIAEVRRLGPEHLTEFDLSLLKPVIWK